MSFYEQLKLLYDQQLYGNVTALASLVLSASETNPDLLSPAQKFQTYVYYADSLYQNKEYKRAESIYKKALQLRKSLAKTKTKAQPLMQPDLISEVDVKYKAHLCLLSLKQYAPAITLLESIPAKQRTSAVNMALAKLHHQNGTERAAITSYKEVLKECPFAIEAAHGLLHLGVKGAEVMSYMQNSSLNIANIEWLSLYMKAYSSLHTKDLSVAITTFKQMDKTTPLRNNVETVVALGESYYYNGDYQLALQAMERAHSMDPILIRGMDIYAALLAKEKKAKDLEKLTSHLLSVNDNAAESWVAMGYYSFIARKPTKALNFVQKACILNPRHVESLLLKGTILLEMKKPQEAAIHFGEAYKIAPFRFETHKGLIDCYLATRRTREAIAIANSACKQLGQTARALTLYASVIIKDPLASEKAKPLLERALKQDPSYLNAVYLLAAIYEQERLYEKGIELLKKHMEQQTSCRLHQLMGDFLARTNEHDKALHHFNLALNMDPTNRKATDGASRVERSNPDSSESFEEMQNVPDSEEELDLEENEIDASWADI